MITKFSVNGHKVVREATCDPVPRVMVICGPNGVGKTTVLDALGRRHGVTTDIPTEILVAPATRTWRREPVQQRMLYSNALSSSEVFNMTSQINTFGGQFGRNIYSAYRDLWSDDDSKQLVKPLLAKMKTRWGEYVSKDVEKANYSTEKREWPNPTKAIAEFTSAMLDELKYVGTVDDGTNARILFDCINNPHGPSIDIDELSSGEKAIFSIFLPIIEEEFRRQMGEGRREIALLIDEIESHLHVSLQQKLLSFMREKSKDGFQFICTTHSTTIIKACAQGELHHILPKGLTTGNQIQKASENIHSLIEIIQDEILFASGYKRFIFCEGFDPSKADEKNVCDAELYEVILGATSRERIVAAGAKEAVETAIRAASRAVFAPLSLVGILDGDGQLGSASTVPWTQVSLPVYSIESILLDEIAIFAAAKRYVSNQQQVSAAIGRAIQRALTDREGQSLDPQSVLRRRDGMSIQDVIAKLKNNDVLGIYEIRPEMPAGLEAEAKRIQEMASNREVALKCVKGKRIYRYLFEELGLHGKGFTPRSFAVEVLKAAKLNGSSTIFLNLERIAKHAVGNALGALLSTSAGDPIKGHKTHSATFTKVHGMIDKIDFGGSFYSVIKEGVRREHFAEAITALSHATREVMPDYRWTHHQ